MPAMSSDQETKYRDTTLRTLECFVLGLLTFGLSIVTSAALLRADLTHQDFWIALTAWYGLASLWWLVLRVRPMPKARAKLPLLVWAGLIVGTTWLTLFVYGSSRSPKSYPVWAYIVYGLPFVILLHRLHCFWTYRKPILGNEARRVV